MRIGFIRFLILVSVLFFWAGFVNIVTSCKSENTPEPLDTTTTTTLVSTTTTQRPAPAPIVLSWETNRPERKEWSKFVLAYLDKTFPVFYTATDNKRFCPGFQSLTREQQIQAMAEIIVSITFYESGFSPVSRTQETTMGIDPVTGKPVFSEGLLQLSYQDVQNYKSVFNGQCRIDWQKDKGLNPTDPAKTILDPITNLHCGLMILQNQLNKKGSWVLSTGVYWAVLKEGGKYQKIEQIINRVKKLNFCTN